MRVLVKVIDPGGVEAARAPFDAVHLVALLQQQLGQVAAVLAGDAGNQGCGMSPFCECNHMKKRSEGAHTYDVCAQSDASFAPAILIDEGNLLRPTDHQANEAEKCMSVCSQRDQECLPGRTLRK